MCCLEATSCPSLLYRSLLCVGLYSFGLPPPLLSDRQLNYCYRGCHLSRTGQRLAFWKYRAYLLLLLFIALFMNEHDWCGFLGEKEHYEDQRKTETIRRVYGVLNCNRHLTAALRKHQAPPLVLDKFISSLSNPCFNLLSCRAAGRFGQGPVK